jgi:16S rRNA (adenine1518-N6/adenine1519-N6)-dimethyltransferase
LSDPHLLEKTIGLLRKYELRPSRRMGQSYVVDPELIDCIIGAAELEKGDTVLEIGAGTGNLTVRIAEKVRKVIAVEKDRGAIRILERQLSATGNVEVVNEDILSMNLPSVDKIVSNLPYSISTPITFKLLLEGDFRLAALTYQKEVADRILAGPGIRAYSRLSVAVALLGEVERKGDFPPASFYPRPKVESTVVALRKRDRNKGDGSAKTIDWKELDDVLKFLFSQRRRTLRKALRTYSKVRGVDTTEVLGGGLEGGGDRRVFELTPEDFLEMARQLAVARAEGQGGKRCGAGKKERGKSMIGSERGAEPDGMA